MLLHFYKKMVEKNVTQGFIIDEEYVLFITIHKMNLFKYQGTKTDGMRDIRINNNLIIIYNNKPEFNPETGLIHVQ